MRKRKTRHRKKEKSLITLLAEIGAIITTIGYLIEKIRELF